MLSRKFVFALLFLTLFTATSAFADSQARIVRLSYLEGNVQLDRGDGNGYIRAFLNMPLIEGASLWSKEDARVEVEFEDGSTIRMVPDTILHFRELRLRNDGSKSSVIDLRSGSAYFNIMKHQADDFRIFPGGREFTLEKSSHFRVINMLSPEPGELGVAIFKGELTYTHSDGQRVSLRKNETLDIDFSDSSRYFLARGISATAHDYWDREREEDRVILARKYERESLRVAYLGDLYHHGSFFEMHGHGRLWRPFGVSYSWNPFDHGSWVWYPQVGYVWISSYSWGWTPYRYGSWVHVGNRGWCWQPGLVYTTWVPVPVIINAPRGYVMPRVPVQPRGPVIHVGRGVDTADLRGGPGGRAGSRILVQDRLRGIREVDARDSGRTLTPAISTGGTVIPRGRSPLDPIGADGIVTPREGITTDSAIRPRVPSTNDTPRSLGERKLQGELGIDAHQDDDVVSIQAVLPADSGRGSAERKRQAEVGIDAQRGEDDTVRNSNPIQTPVRIERRETSELPVENHDSPGRTSRIDRVERVERPTTPAVRPQVREDRSPPPQRTYAPPPQRTYTPPPSSTPSAAPAPRAPSATPSAPRSAPSRDSVRDQ